VLWDIKLPSYRRQPSCPTTALQGLSVHICPCIWASFLHEATMFRETVLRMRQQRAGSKQFFSDPLHREMEISTYQAAKQGSSVWKFRWYTKSESVVSHYHSVTCVMVEVGVFGLTCSSATLALMDPTTMSLAEWGQALSATLTAFGTLKWHFLFIFFLVKWRV